MEEFLTTTSSEAGTQTSSYPDEAEGLDSFRRDLDAIDALLLETVRQRLELCPAHRRVEALPRGSDDATRPRPPRAGAGA